MRVAIVRTMPEFSIDIYSENLISGLKKVRPNWEIIELVPRAFDRTNSSFSYRVQKYYERFWGYPRLVSKQISSVDLFHVVEPCDGHIVYWLKNKGKPIVVTCHDLINFSFPDNTKSSTQLPQLSDNAWKYSVKGMKYADRIISVSAATAKDTTQILNIAPELINVVPNGVESIFQPLPKEQVKSLRDRWESSSTFCLLNVGTNHPRKNISNILQALAILKEMNLSFQFWKVGADFTVEQQQFIQNHNLTSNIKYLGKPDKLTLCEIYNAADLLLAPSLYEGFGITILEAMACGTPVITGEVSAMPEVVGDAGVLVDPKDAKAIANAVNRLQKDSLYYQQLSKKSLERVKLFTWEQTAEKVAEVYEKLLFEKEILKK
jgi:glycosyltransferase involved in cell wall biosynthesis